MHSRRYFIKTVLLGAFVTLPGCSPPRAPAPALAPRPRRAGLRGEHYETCHAVRDDADFPRAEVTASHDVVIVGGGPSGLCAAYLLRERDLLLLEKEDLLGGNCILDEWQGVKISTGGAFYTETEKDLVALFREIGAAGRKVVGGDSLVVDGHAVTDFFRDGADALPFPQKVRDDFKRSREGLLKLLKTSKPEELDKVAFAELLEDYDPMVTRFWDRFGPSNWGGMAAETSGYIGAQAYTWAGGADDPRWTFPGGLAAGAHALAEWLRPKLSERLLAGAAVYRVECEQKRPGAIVRYVREGKPFAVRARTVVMAVPKFYASYVVVGLPKPQVEAMRAFRYAPYPVFNVCLNEPGPEPAYDNWLLDTPFTDFIPADWILYAGKGPKQRKTALTVYHPLPPERRAELLAEPVVLDMADRVAAALERHFPGTIPNIAEIRVFRRGHPMCVPNPGRFALVERASVAFGPVVFAHTDSLGGVSTFDGALVAARRASEAAQKFLKA